MQPTPLRQITYQLQDEQKRFNLKNIEPELVLSCLIHATGWANAPRWGEGRSPPTTPIYAPKALGKPPCRGSHHPSSVFH
jgi:hypothetical protein